jgi:hypothetical protein
MALYAFDGTWNEDEDDLGGDTNVRMFLDYYEWLQEHENYREGVGTRKSVLGKIAGGMSGAGGRKRVRGMVRDLEEAFAAGDERVDVIGFSRGAALALHFCHSITTREFKNAVGKKVTPRVKFLGLWDVVASFGMPLNILIPFQKINLGWKLSVPDRVDVCYHAMAIHERRQTFRLTRLDPGNNLNHVHECWFRGVHSDIGGGNGNEGRSNLALKWMLDMALTQGCPIDGGKLLLLEDLVDDAARIKWPTDIIKNSPRKRFPDDCYHDSARPRRLQVGQSVTVRVRARKKYNWAGIWVEPGQAYSIEVADGQVWYDKGIESGAGGWKTDEVGLHGARKWFVRRKEGARRVADADWSELCATVGEDEDNHFRIGTGRVHPDHWKCGQSGPLYFFCKFVKKKY